MTVKVVISGPRGKMGSQVYNKLKGTENIQIVGLLDYKLEKWSDAKSDIPVFDDAKKCFTETMPDVFIDFTNAEASSSYIEVAIKQKVKVITGTTGFSDEQLDYIAALATDHEVGCVVAPNFALGAALMIILSPSAAQYFDHINILERHHEQKYDIPSGTAHTIQQLIEENTNKKPKTFSVRSTGYIAHHEVVFGGAGQVLTIKHDSFNRDSFLHGLMLTVDEIHHINEFVFGLENVLRL